MKEIVLIQFRKDISADWEKRSFLKFFKRKKLKLKIVNVFDKKINFSRSEKLLKNAKGIILGGSGELYFSKKEKNLKEILKRISPLINHLLKKDFPTLGICFGHQMIGYFLGGKVIADKKQEEIGSFLVNLTEQGKKSPLFLGFPSKFFAQFGHKDSLKNLPPKSKLLAKTEKCKVVAFRYKNRIFGVQFHPELTLEDILSRVKLYPEYLPKPINEFKKNLKPSPFAPKVIENFLKIVKGS